MARFRPGAAFVPPGAPLASIAPPAPLAAMADLASVTLSVKVVDFSSAATSAIERAIRGAIQASTRGLPGLTPRGGPAPGKETGLAALGESVGVMIAAVSAATYAVRGVVALASPGTVERFDLAIKDATAVVGQALTPVLEQATGFVRLFGDYLATILPSADEFRQILAPLNGFLQDMRDALSAIAPIIHDVLLQGLKALGVALQVVLIPIRLLAKFLEGLFGAGEGLKTSVGAAVRNVSFQSAESFAKQVNLAAFKSGIGTGKSPVEKIGEDVAKIGEILKDIGAWVRGIAQKMSVDIGPPGFARHGPLEGFKVSAGLGGIKVTHDEEGRRNPMALDLSDAIKKTRGKLLEIEEGRSAARNPEAFFKQLLEFLRSELREKGTPESDIESEIQRHLDQAKRRGIDGHPGGR